MIINFNIPYILSLHMTTHPLNALILNMGLGLVGFMLIALGNWIKGEESYIRYLKRLIKWNGGYKKVFFLSFVFGALSVVAGIIEILESIRVLIKRKNKS